MKGLIKKNISLKELTTFHIGGKAKYYAEVKSDEEISFAFNFAKENNLPVFILGGGSDILVNDSGFDGLVIKFVGEKVSFKRTVVTGEAGISWDAFVEKTIEKNLQGLECLSGIPGTLGASPIQNIGAYGSELKDNFLSLRTYDSKDDKFIEFDKKMCEFSYRESIFKKRAFWQRFLITQVSFRLKKNGKPEIKYESLIKYLDDKGLDNPTLKEVREAVIAIRKEKLEDPKVIGNAGSFFKNPIIKKKELSKLKKDYPDIPSFSFGRDFKLAAGWLIEKAGLKGEKYNNVAVSKKNALILVNPERKATANDVTELSNIIIKTVSEVFGVILEPEVQFIGFGKEKKKIAILGLGMEGKDALSYFLEKGFNVSIFDRKKKEELDLEGIDQTNLGFYCGKDYKLALLKDFDAVVRSPGVYRYLPQIVKAEKEGVEITSSVKIFFDHCSCNVVGVTGTKGKGTTSTLIYEILKNEGKDVYLAGNIGIPYLSLLSELKKDSIVVLELSSFQLIDLTKSPNIAVVLNVTLDHMDWHKSKDEYIKAKENIVRFQKEDDYAVVNSDYETSKSFGRLTKGKVLYFSKLGKVGGCFVKDGKIFLDVNGKKNLIGETKNLQLRGEHNWENVTAAICASYLAGASIKKITESVFSFKGLEHRLELVDSIKGVSFYNDSFSTGPQPAIAAIKSFIEPITVILGGSDKGLNYDELGKVISSTKNINAVILIGQMASTIKRLLTKAGYKGEIYDSGMINMTEIVKKAYQVSPKGGVVVLSPAAASFDMFKNYKDRGNQFKEAVLRLKNEN